LVPVPKVIDFGIAKARQAELKEKTIFTPALNRRSATGHMPAAILKSTATVIRSLRDCKKQRCTRL
jgi:hypothetical protein